jgi:Ni/Fe-hydrogenase subunit HybB-like protein
MAESLLAEPPLPTPTPLQPDPVLLGGPDNASNREITRSLFRYVWLKPGKGWLGLVALSFLGAAWFFFAIGYTVWRGIGTWGNNIPVAWAFAITSFVWWIGIGHAGTLISAILLLFLQRWRTSINRFAEAMTLFAVLCAGIMPVLHLGRPWYAFFLIPYPARTGMWPNFKSPLVWDFFAVSTYLTVSVLFWYLGLLPDLAAMRDASQGLWRRRIYGLFSFGWRGSARHWQHYYSAYVILAGLATPLVLSVHTIVSFDFAVAQLPGWHSTIFGPYFVAGAIYSGFAMVLTLLIPARAVLKIKHVVTERHLANCAKLLLTTGWVVTFSYATEIWTSWYSGDKYDWGTTVDRLFGHYAFWFWLTIACNCVLPQIFWFDKARRNPIILFVASIFVNLGMWVERFVIVVQSLHHDFLASSWRDYAPTWVDYSILFGSMSFFLFCFLLFLRVVPAVPVSEVKEMRHELLKEGA